MSAAALNPPPGGETDGLLHLLVDRDQDAVAHAAEPKSGDSAARTGAPVGEPPPLPEPYSPPLDTARFA